MEKEEFEKIWQKAQDGADKVRDRYLQKFAALSPKEQEKELELMKNSRFWEDCTDGFIPPVLGER